MHINFFIDKRHRFSKNRCLWSIKDIGLQKTDVLNVVFNFYPRGHFSSTNYFPSIPHAVIFHPSIIFPPPPPTIFNPIVLSHPILYMASIFVISALLLTQPPLIIICTLALLNLHSLLLLFDPPFPPFLKDRLTVIFIRLCFSFDVHIRSCLLLCDKLIAYFIPQIWKRFAQVYFFSCINLFIFKIDDYNFFL